MEPRQLGLLSAARRHVRDAEHLLAEGPGRSPDQAWHLAGFGPECVRKACLADDLLDKALGHDLGEAADALLEWGLALDPHAARYHLDGWVDSYPVLSKWKPSHRYDRTGAHDDRDGSVTGLVQAARALVDRVVADLWADGRITGREP